MADAYEALLAAEEEKERRLLIEGNYLSSDYRDVILRVLGLQEAELSRGELVTCPCGANLGIKRMYRCRYCEVVFCRGCADRHFSVPERLPGERAASGVPA